MSTTTIRPSVHVVKDTPVARMFRRRLKFDDIITFWSAETGQWILGYWLDKRLQIVDEMEDLGMVFEKVTPELVEQITVCWRAVDWRAKKKRLVSKERDRIRKENDDLMEQQERWDWAQKQQIARGRGPIPYAFGTPISGGQVK